MQNKGRASLGNNRETEVEAEEEAAEANC